MATRQQGDKFVCRKRVEVNSTEKLINCLNEMIHFKTVTVYILEMC